MNKYFLGYFGFDNNGYAIVDAENENDAYAKFIEYYGIPYPLNKKNIETLCNDFDFKQFKDYFENQYSNTIYDFGKIDLLFKKEVK